jgi:AraC family transcriptional regulator
MQKAVSSIFLLLDGDSGRLDEYLRRGDGDGATTNIASSIHVDRQRSSGSRAMPDSFVAVREIRMPSPAGMGLPLRLVAVTRSERERTPASMFSFWLQLRGSAQVSAAEGSFRLEPGDWIALDRGSAGEIQGARNGLTLGLMLAPDLMHGVLDSTDRGLLTGRGRLTLSDRRAVVRLWRACAARQADAETAVVRALKPLLQQLQLAQRDFAAMIERCPGRSYHRKARIFSRIQKARLYLEGNPQRMLRIEDLMELTRFSSWWLSKTFHAVYQETLQRASMRLRMQRARELLEHSQLSISELAEACGFHDPCSFARQFKAWHGETASAWRMRNQPARPEIAPDSPMWAAAH